MSVPRAWGKTHNASAATEAKIELRLKVLEHVRPAHVFDAFCGPDGVQWEGAWKNAESYVGCDTAFKITDPRRRFVGDSRRVMRSIDLAPYNVFDFDAFGAPWEWLIILAARRRWAPREKGAIIITDGSTFTVSLGGVPRALGELVGIARTAGMAPKAETANALQHIAMAAWCQRAGVVPIEQWRAEGRTGLRVIYWGMVFEGKSREASNTA